MAWMQGRWPVRFIVFQPHDGMSGRVAASGCGMPERGCKWLTCSTWNLSPCAAQRTRQTGNDPGIGRHRSNRW